MPSLLGSRGGVNGWVARELDKARSMTDE